MRRALYTHFDALIAGLSEQQIHIAYLNQLHRVIRTVFYLPLQEMILLVNMYHSHMAAQVCADT